MRKILFSFAILMMATFSAFAQNSLVATLSHGSDVKMFYGTNAFTEAMTAAVDGDVINLSGGIFQATNITKAVTLRGTGIDETVKTIIGQSTSASLTINIPSSTTTRLSIEGIYFNSAITLSGTLNDILLTKSYFSSLSMSGTISNALFANCKISKFNNSGATNIQCLNSYVAEITQSNSSARVNFVNCVIVPSYRYNSSGGNQTGSYADASKIEYSNLYNCIIVNLYSKCYLFPSTTEIQNCVATDCTYSLTYYSGTTTYKIFDNITSGSNNHYATKSIFLESNPLYDLTDAAKATYLGTDDTPVGMYGGQLPYNTTPSYPRITKMNIASKTTSDGKLNVEIEVSPTK